MEIETIMRTWHSNLLVCITAFALAASATETSPCRLACDLAEEGDHAAAALEFRRLALTAEAPTSAGLAWAAAYEYVQAGIWPAADKMLNYAEDADLSLDLPVLLLRAESAASQNQPEAADFYYQAARSHRSASTELQRYAAIQSAALLIGLQQPDAARAALADAPGTHDAAQQALTKYEAGHDKKPWLGGILGIIPGLGYAYSGEYANAARSLILNSLFIFGMVNTAQHDDWGAFAVITFFEFTWYSGSIYGGIDAAHRYNHQRLQDCQSQIVGNTGYKPDRQRFPIVALQFEF